MKQPGSEEAGATTPRGDAGRVAQVQEILDQIRPMLAMDGGDVELIAVEDDGWVEVRMQGSCCGCAMQAQTLFGGLEPRLRQTLDWFAGLRPAR